MSNEAQISLPDGLSTMQQLRKVEREIEEILDQAVQGHIRKAQTGQSFSVKKPSQLLSELLVLHNAQLTEGSLRELKATVQDIKNRAVVLRVVLSSEPSPDVQSRLVRWFRSNFKTPVLLRFGIQPNIAGGCIVYTPNHRHDLSLRKEILTSDISMRQALEHVG